LGIPPQTSVLDMERKKKIKNQTTQTEENKNWLGILFSSEMDQLLIFFKRKTGC
jgi:hypothetical protein